MPPVLHTKVLSQFSCLGDKCSDTCCKGWAMQMDETTLARYREKAPELLASVEPGREAPWVMRRDSSGHCVRLENGWCGIHKSHGASFLGDACFFYPRVTRRLGESVRDDGYLVLPEIARLALFVENDPAAFAAIDADRLPQTLKNYLPVDMNDQDALAVHRIFLDAALDETVAPERASLRIQHVSRFLEGVKKTDWPRAIPFYLANADAQLPSAEKNPADPFNVLHMLCGLIVATQRPLPDRLRQTVEDMEKALDVTLDWQNVRIETHAGSAGAYKIKERWEMSAKNYDGILRRWLAMQLSVALYPFAGFGRTLQERATLMGVRFAILRLALMCRRTIIESEIDQEGVVRIAQSLSRLLDHLADPEFSSQICHETGWEKPSRMRGLLE